MKPAPMPASSHWKPVERADGEIAAVSNIAKHDAGFACCEQVPVVQEATWLGVRPCPVR